MSSKNNPGEFDCYAEAMPSEEMFILLERDELAAGVVRSWARRYWWRKIFPIYIWDYMALRSLELLDRRLRKYHEALRCAERMEATSA